MTPQQLIELYRGPLMRNEKGVSDRIVKCSIEVSLSGYDPGEIGRSMLDEFPDSEKALTAAMRILERKI
jgi:hypothetical protein